MFLRLASPEPAASVVVCDPACARAALPWLSVPVVALAHELPPDAHRRGGLPDACLRCVACGGLTEDPYPRACLWHPEGCPAWQQAHTAAAASVVHRLAAGDGLVLDDLALRQIEHTLTRLAALGALDASGEGGGSGVADPDVAYRLLRPWLAP